MVTPSSTSLDDMSSLCLCRRHLTGRPVSTRTHLSYQDSIVSNLDGTIIMQNPLSNAMVLCFRIRIDTVRNVPIVWLVYSTHKYAYRPTGRGRVRSLPLLAVSSPLSLCLSLSPPSLPSSQCVWCVCVCVIVRSFVVVMVC